MKNIHILSTDEQIKNVGDVVKDQYGDIHIFTKNDGKEYGKTTTKLNIYITDDEEIKEGDWIFDIVTKKIEIAKFNHNDLKRDWKKIILTTDKDLIKDGVQAIDDEFLQWFVKNPSCDEIEVKMNQGRYFDYGGNVHITNAYKIIIPKQELKKNWYCAKCDSYVSSESVTIEETHQTGVIIEEPKQETLEEVAERILANNIDGLRDALKDDDLFFFYKGVIQCYGEAMAKWQQERSYSEEEVIAFGEFIFKHTLLAHSKGVKDLFEQFKKK